MLTSFEELLRQVDEEFPRFFPVGGKSNEPRSLKNIDRDCQWRGSTIPVRFLIDPALLPKPAAVVDVIGLRPNGYTYPLSDEIRVQFIRQLVETPGWDTAGSDTGSDTPPDEALQAS